MAKIDLHMHTTASDGQYAPADLVRRCRRAGYEAIAICDHDTVNGVAEALQAGKKFKQTVFPGVEMSSVLKDVSVHIAGLGLDYHNKKLRQRFRRYHKNREQRGRKVVKKLKRLGFKITFQEVDDLAAGIVTRTHIGEALLQHSENIPLLKKYVSKKLNVSHVIQGLIFTGKPAYVSYRKMSTRDDIKLIHQAGGLAIFCHPWFFEEDFPHKSLDKFTASLKRLGVDGMECFPNPKNYQKYLRLARKYNLIISAGSDFHGPVHKQKFGEFNVPSRYLQDILSRLDKP